MKIIYYYDLNNMEKIILNYLNKRFKKRSMKLDRNTVLLNKDLELDSIDFLNLIIFVEKKTKKKFLNQGYARLMNIKISDFVKFFN